MIDVKTKQLLLPTAEKRTPNSGWEYQSKGNVYDDTDEREDMFNKLKMV